MEEEKQVVNEEQPTPAPVSEDAKTQEVEANAPEEVKPQPQPGDKTEPNLLLKSLQEERERRRILEEENKQLKESSVSSEKIEDLPDYEMLTETEKLLAKEVFQLKEKAKWEEDISRTKTAFPTIAGKEAEFKEYCSKFPKSMDVEVLAKSFLFDAIPPVPKKGLEAPTGGPKSVATSEYTIDDIGRLRETQPKLYEELIKKGRLPKKVSDLK